MCQGAARASCAPGKESWEPSAAARLPEAVAAAERSQGAEWYLGGWAGLRDRDQGQAQHSHHSPAQRPCWSEPSQGPEPTGVGPGQDDRQREAGAQAQLLPSPRGTHGEAAAEKQLPGERRGRHRLRLSEPKLVSVKEPTLDPAS